MKRSMYQRTHWNKYQKLIANGSTSSQALNQLGIPYGSLSKIKARFGGPARDAAKPQADVPSSPPAQSPSISELAIELNAYTETLLELASQLAELTRHAYGLAALDATLEQLESRQQESAGLRRRLGEAESQLLARAAVVHSQ